MCLSGEGPKSGMGLTWSVTFSLVTTATTPGTASAAEVSMLTILAWAMVLRATATSSMFGTS